MSGNWKLLLTETIPIQQTDAGANKFSLGVRPRAELFAR
jgi:hypothetical protein